MLQNPKPVVAPAPIVLFQSAPRTRSVFPVRVYSPFQNELICPSIGMSTIQVSADDVGFRTVTLAQ